MHADGPGAEPCFRLPLSFDVDLLRRDLAAVQDLPWPPEAPFIMRTPFEAKTQTYHDGRWKGLALRSQGGDWRRTDPGGPGLELFADTEILARTPHLREVVDALDCEKRSVRLLSLPGGAEVKAHTDPYHGFKFGQVRLHCPIVTHPDVQMHFDGRVYHWPAGELWYADFGRPHAVRNASAVTRVHLVIDALISPALLGLFPAAFVERQWRAGILLQETPAPLADDRLERCVCDFSLPAALVQGILETDDGSVPGELTGGIRVEGSRLVVCVEGMALFGLVPVGDHRFTLAGWTPERLVELTPGAGGRVEALTFRLRAGRTESTIRLPAHPIRSPA